MKTPIRWAGSKKTLLPVLRKNWLETEGRYIEPFCGSACLFFDLEPKRAILGDINSELITTYRALKSDAAKVFNRLQRIPRNKRSYYKTRAVDPSTLSEIDAAARFIFLNRLCFNGIYRTNKNGIFNVPYAKPKNRIWLDRKTIIKLGERLEKVSLVSGDFEVVLGKAKSGDFVYLDPPYAVVKRRVFAEYHPDSFSENDLKRLNAALFQLDRRGVHFLISYADSAEGRALAKNWHAKRIRTRRNVAGFIGDRRHAFEIIASNKEIVDAH